MKKIAIKLLAAAKQYNSPAFVAEDPISVPHLYTQKEDREIAGLFSATFAWGRRDLIIRSAQQLMVRMGHEPFRFVMQASYNDLRSLHSFVHRTFNGQDAVAFVLALRTIYENQGGLEAVFTEGARLTDTVEGGLLAYRNAMYDAMPPAHHSRKHVPDIERNSAAKRISMYLRWMVRRDTAGVDFGLWGGIPMAKLVLPLDVHTGRTARAFGLLQRKQNDWRAVQEVTAHLREIAPEDPVLLDFALFGLGVYAGKPPWV